MKTEGDKKELIHQEKRSAKRRERPTQHDNE